jgi:phospholipase/lecithinase/hemolysin
VDAEVVTPAEFKGLRDAVAGYNAFIQQQATAHGWAYLDVNPTLVASKANPALITTFPNLPSAATGGNVTFGSFFSLDGVHPSSAAHRVIADSIISAVNATYQTTIPFAGP